MKLLAPGDPGYDAARRVWNGMIDRRPALIARCFDTADVVRAVRLARERGLPMSVKGGGHNIAGSAVCDGGVVVDLSPMREVAVDLARRVARAQAGCLLGDVDRATQPYGVAAVLGLVSQTGIAGLTVGGGLGYLTRRGGWTVDTVRAMEVVTADGIVLRAAPDENPELFHALRGGGGRFGVVTWFEYELVTVGADVLGGGVAWPGARAADVLHFYRELTAAAPRELTCLASLRVGPGGEPLVGIAVCHSGDPADAERAATRLRGFGAPIVDTLARRPYAEVQRSLDAHQPAGRRYYFKSHNLARLDDGLLEAVAAERGRFVSPHSSFLFVHLAGALNERPADHTPMGHRDAAYLLAIGAGWSDAAADDENIAWARRAYAATRPFATGTEYLNFLNAGEDRAVAYDSSARARLDALAGRLAG